ncbi:MAG TPA: hypothetical protein VGQ83_06535 [Polyangia bacterium]|jgi:hypothetical protein
MRAAVIVALALGACGGPPAAPAGGGRCVSPAASVFERDTSLPGRRLAVPPECCFVPGPAGGQIRCPESALSWSLLPQPEAAARLLDQYVTTYRNTATGNVTERQAGCQLLGVPTTCWRFSALPPVGSAQPLHAVAGAITVEGKGLLAACQFYRGAGLPAVCRQIFTP